jgi:hypothetical protein
VIAGGAFPSSLPRFYSSAALRSISIPTRVLFNLAALPRIKLMYCHTYMIYSTFCDIMAIGLLICKGSICAWILTLNTVAVCHNVQREGGSIIIMMHAGTHQPRVLAPTARIYTCMKFFCWG